MLHPHVNKTPYCVIINYSKHIQGDNNMIEQTRQHADTFIANFKSAQELCQWAGDRYAATMAVMLIGDEKPMPADRLSQAQQIIKDNKGVFSEFRSGYARKVAVSAVAMSDDPEQALTDLGTIKKMLKPGMFSTFMYDVTACIIQTSTKPEDYELVVDRTMELFGAVIKKHSIIGSEGELADCAVIAKTDKDTAHTSEEQEECYKEVIKFNGKGSDSLHAAAAMTLFGGGTDIRAEKVKGLKETQKADKFKFTYDGIGMTALLAGLYGDHPADIIAEMKEVSEELKAAKGMGGWTISDGTRNLIAAGITVAARTDDPVYTLFAKQFILNVICSQMQSDDSTAATVTTTMM